MIVAGVPYPFVLFCFFNIHFFFFFFLAVLVLHCYAQAFLWLAESRGFSLVAAHGFSLQWHLLLQAQAQGSQASGVAAHGLSSCSSQVPEHRLSSCGAWADHPRPEIQLVSPALQGEFLTTRSPGKPRYSLFLFVGISAKMAP